MMNRTDIERLFLTHYARMHRLAKVFLHDDDLSRDIVHDVFASLFDMRRDSLVTPGYLFSAVRNRCLNHLRNLDTRQRVMNLYFADVEEYDEEEWPDEKTIAEIYAIIKNDLPQQCCRVVELRFSAGMKIEEVAYEMGVSQNAVFKHLRHALSIIRKKLNR